MNTFVTHQQNPNACYFLHMCYFLVEKTCFFSGHLKRKNRCRLTADSHLLSIMSAAMSISQKSASYLNFPQYSSSPDFETLMLLLLRVSMSFGFQSITAVRETKCFWRAVLESLPFNSQRSNLEYLSFTIKKSSVTAGSKNPLTISRTSNILLCLLLRSRAARFRNLWQSLEFMSLRLEIRMVARRCIISIGILCFVVGITSLISVF